MAPSFPSHYPADVAGANSKSASDFKLGHAAHAIHIADFDYIAILELALSAFFSTWVILTAFFNLVLHVLFLAAKEKMLRVATRPVVALVENLRAGWYCTIMNLPRKAVGSHIHAFAANLVPEVAVAIFIFRVNPLPASCRLVDGKF